MYRLSTRPVTVFNTLCRLCAIHSQVIDFGGIVNGDVTSNLAASRSKRPPMYWRNYCFMCGIAFALSYPVAAYRLLSNYHIWPAKSINYYVYYLYYSSRYFVVVSIFFMQVRHSHESCGRQYATFKIFRQINDLNRCTANGSACEERKRLAMALNVIDWWQIVQLIVAFVCYMCTNYLKLTFNIQRANTLNAYDKFWFYYANIIIRLYASMFSIRILQQAKLFELLNQTIKAIKNDADETPATAVPFGPSAVRFISNGRHSKRRADGVWQPSAQSHDTFGKRIKLLMKLHDELRANNLKLDKLHSIPAISVVANGFMNLVSQVKWRFNFFSIADPQLCLCVIKKTHIPTHCLQLYFAYCDAFGYPHPPRIVIVFTFIKAQLHFIEVTIIFGACERLKNKVHPFVLQQQSVDNNEISISYGR